MKHNSTTLCQSLLVGIGLLLLGSGGVIAQGAHAKKPVPHSHAKLTAAQAQAIALKKYPGKVAGKINLEDEEGSWQYAVNVRSGKTLREVMVDANTGKIASVEITSKAEEAKELKAEMAKAKHPVSMHKSGKAL